VGSGNALPHNLLNTNVGKPISPNQRKGRGGVEQYIVRIWPILLKTNTVNEVKNSLFNIRIIMSNICQGVKSSFSGSCGNVQPFNCN